MNQLDLHWFFPTFQSPSLIQWFILFLVYYQAMGPSWKFQILITSLVPTYNKSPMKSSVLKVWFQICSSIQSNSKKFVSFGPSKKLYILVPRLVQARYSSCLWKIDSSTVICSMEGRIVLILMKQLIYRKPLRIFAIILSITMDNPTTASKDSIWMIQ